MITPTVENLARVLSGCFKFGHHDIQHNDTQHKDTRHNEIQHMNKKMRHSAY